MVRKPVRFMLVLSGFLMVALPAIGDDLFLFAKKTLESDWSRSTLGDSAEAPLQNVDTLLYAPVPVNGECQTMRVVDIRRSVASGVCVECIQLEFVPDASGTHRLTGFLLDAVASSVDELDAMTTTLLSSTEAPSADHQKDHRRRNWALSDRWSTPTEARSLELRVKRAANGKWRLHVECRRFQLHAENVTH
jgi:hypothetical protein